MFTDNGIYIIKDRKGYRVAHCQAIENIYTDKSYVDEYFSDSAIYQDIQQAFKEAIRLFDELNAKEYEIEYGIKYLGDINRRNNNE